MPADIGVKLLVNDGHTMRVGLLCLSLGSCLALVSGSGSGGLEINEAYELREYRSYADVAITTYSIPDGTLWALWRFTISTDTLDCPVENATVYLQRQGLPVFRPLGERLPLHFAPDRYEFAVNLSSATVYSHSYDLFYPNPTPGMWFSSGFLVPKEGPSAITQQGFGSKCHTFLKATVVYDTSPGVEVINVGTQQTVFTTGNTIFRFKIPKHVYAYTITVASCNTVNISSRSSSSNITSDAGFGSNITSNSVSYNVSGNNYSNNYDDISDIVYNFTSDSVTYTIVTNSGGTAGDSSGDGEDISADGNISAGGNISTDGNSSRSCVFKLYSSGTLSPKQSSPFVSECDFSSSSSCTLSVDSVEVDRWHYVGVVPDDSQAAMALTMSVTTYGCAASPSAGVCAVDEFYPINIPGVPYTVKYSSVSAIGTQQTLYDDKVTIQSFETKALLHSGGTIQHHLSVSQVPKGELVRLYSCVQHQKFSVDMETVKNCSSASNAVLDTGAGQKFTNYYIPYPQDGIYYSQIVAECYSREDNSVVVPCISSITARVNVSVSPCIGNKCGDYGTCYSYYSGVMHWSVCRCIAGYRGVACSDDTYAESKGFQLLQTLLLTLSNVVFLGSACVAISKKWFNEAVIYMFVFFSSTFYHACDNKTLYTFCIFNYSLLQYSDFFASIMAVWVTAMALAELPYKLRALFHVLGFIGILIGTQSTLTSLWTFLVPLLIAAGILATSWVRMCVTSKQCFPDKKIWLWQILPGSVCAIVGVVLYSALETDANYYYTHSLWHILMAVAVIFLLPRHERLDKKFIRDKLAQIADCCSSCWKCSLHDVKRRQDVEDVDNAENSSTLIVGSTQNESKGTSSTSAPSPPLRSQE